MGNQYYKQWTKKLITTVFATLSIITITNFIVDPFQIYRQAHFYTFKAQDQRYLNIGLAKNYPYETLLIGSSMVETISLQDIKQYGSFSKPIKLTFEGGHLKEITSLLQLAITNNKNLKTIIIGVDLFAFSAPTEPIYIPTYLYNSYIYDDVYYLLNFKVFSKSLQNITVPYDKAKLSETLNTLYSWQPTFQNSFTLQNVYNSYCFHKNLVDKEDKINYLRHNNRQVLQNNFSFLLLPILKQNPNIQFYLFYTPSSILSFKLLQQEGGLREYQELKRYIFEHTKSLTNVKIYDFQIADEIILNLHNYKDIGHYNQNVNKWILKQLQNNTYLVTSNNIDSFLNKFYYQPKKYRITHEKCKEMQ